MVSSGPVVQRVETEVELLEKLNPVLGLHDWIVVRLKYDSGLCLNYEICITALIYINKKLGTMMIPYQYICTKTSKSIYILHIKVQENIAESTHS
jgi:hypothetical protein